MKKLLFVGNIAMMLCLSAQSYQWVQADKVASLGNGDITVQWEGEKVKSFTKTSSSDAVITGDVLEFVSGGLVSLSPKSLTFELPIVFEGSVTFSNSNCGEEISYDGEPLSGKDEKKVFENVNIDEWTPIYGIYNKKNWPNLKNHLVAKRNLKY